MINILPIDDIKEHIEHPWCWCNPTICEGSFGEQLVIHNSSTEGNYLKKTIKEGLNSEAISERVLLLRQTIDEQKRLRPP